MASIVFRCGRCSRSGTRVTPLPGSGVLDLDEQNDRLIWKAESKSNDAEQQITIQLKDVHVEWKQVQPKVFLLRIKNENDSKQNTDYFFWTQDTEEQMEKFTQLMREKRKANDRAGIGSRASNTGTRGVANAMQTTAAQLARAATHTENTTTTSALLQHLQTWARQIENTQRTQLTLNEILEVDRFANIINDEDVERLREFLPETQCSREDLIAQLRCPQFQSTLSRLSTLLNSAQYGQVLTSFNLDPNTSQLGVLGFIEAIEKAVEHRNNHNNNTGSQ